MPPSMPGGGVPPGPHKPHHQSQQMPSTEQRLDLVERDVRDHSKSITDIITDQRATKNQVGELEQDKAVRTVEDKHLDERLDRIEERIAGVYQLGLWLLGAVGMALIAIIVEFVARGGLTHVS